MGSIAEAMCRVAKMPITARPQQPSRDRDGVIAKLSRLSRLIDGENWNNIDRGGRSESAFNRLVPRGPLVGGIRCARGVLTVAFGSRMTTSLSVQHACDPVTLRLSHAAVRNARTVKLLNQSTNRAAACPERRRLSRSVRRRSHSYDQRQVFVER